MEEDYTFLKVGKMLDSNILRKTGKLNAAAGKMGQYASLLLGVYAVSRGTPDIFTAVLSGASYVTSIVLESNGISKISKAEAILAAEKKEELDRRLNHLERIAKGRVESARIIKPQGEDLAELEKEIIVGSNQKPEYERLLPGERAEADTAKETFPKKGDTDKISKPQSGWKKQA